MNTTKLNPFFQLKRQKPQRLNAMILVGRATLLYCLALVLMANPIIQMAVPDLQHLAPRTAAAATVCTNETIGDSFPSETSYSTNSGSQNWTTSWVETGDDALPQWTGSSNIFISTALVLGFTGQAISIARSLDLQGVTAATLTFDSGDPTSSGFALPYSDLTVNQEIYAEVYNGSSWTTVHTINSGNLGAVGPIDILPAINTSGDTQIRFRTNTHSDWSGGNTGAFVDNISIASSTCMEVELGTISGFVFQDLNLDGKRDGNEPGLADVNVTVTDTSGDVFNTTTAANGTYIVTHQDLADAARVEFELPAALSDLQPTAWGAHHGTTAQFVDLSGGSATASAGFGTIEANSGCDASNAIIAVACYQGGTGVGNTAPGFITFPYDASGRYPGSGTVPTVNAQIQNVGTAWGTAYRPSTKELYTAAFLKRHAGLGPLATRSGNTVTVDGIYKLDYSSGTGSFDPSNPGFTLQGVSGIDLGTVRRDVDSNNRLDNDYELLDDPGADTVDLDAFAKIGKVGFGDADISEDGNTLWLVNLNQAALIAVTLDDASNPIPTDGSPAPAATVSQTAIPSPGCTGGDFRPWGLKFTNGKGYVGAICSAENSQSTANLTAYVLSFDPANLGSGFTTELSFALDYTREMVNPFHEGNWHPWAADWDDTGYGTTGNGEIGYPQPILSDIEFADDGDMILGFNDRWGHQLAYFTYRAMSNGWNYGLVAGNVAGDTIHLCAGGSGGWILEGQTGCAANDVGGVSQSILTNDGPSNVGEYYYEDDYFQFTTGFYHNEVTTGGLTRLPGKNEVLTTAFDPERNTSAMFTQGVRWMDTTTGKENRWYDFVPNGNEYFGKSSGLGDLEVIIVDCDVSTPVEIGNRAWKDDDGDGIQDPGEAGIPGLTVELLDGDDVVVASAITNISGEYYFSSQQGTDSSSAKYGLALEYDTTAVYKVRIQNASGASQPAVIRDYVMSGSNQGSNDLIDSDATLSGNHAIINVDTAGNNHSYDFGFIPFFDLALRKTSSVQYVYAGSNATFSIEILNQGDRPADQIQLIDYIPANLSLNDGDWTASGANAVITLNSGDELPANGLQPGKAATVEITLQANGGLADDVVMVNRAEIATSQDLGGTTVSDIDSTMDSTSGNDTLVDNAILDDALDNLDNDNDGTVDEDDHDVASVTVKSTAIYDLALRKQLVDGQSTRVTPGEDVVFEIQVFNQGTQNSGADRIDLIDRYPTGFTLSPNDSAGWVDQGNNTATLDITDNLTAGASKIVTITLIAGSTLGDLNNYAEIKADHPTRTDVDSQPEDDEGDGNEDALTDDIFDQSPPIDEDDHDVATITVFNFDLALTKVLAPGEPNPVARGSEVTFVMNITNQGSVDAYDIVVADYLPPELSLSENDNHGWSVISDTVVINSIAGPIGPSGSPTSTAQLSITLSVTDTASLGTLTNYGEVVSASELPGGGVAIDSDSTPNAEPGDDSYTTDNSISGDGKNGGDEDDHDPATITIDNFDLALTKVYLSDSSSDRNSSDGIIKVGDQVTFRINVINQGAVDAYDVTVLDYIPGGFFMDDSDSSINIDKGWGIEDGYNGATPVLAAQRTIPGPIAANGGTASIDIVLVVAGPNNFMYAGDPIGVHTNYAEIVSASDRSGGLPVVDDDSTGNNDLANDTFGGDNVVNNASGDEDDHDPATVTVASGFDLALITYLDSSSLDESNNPKSVEPGDLVVYTILVENQGLIEATDISLIDYLPTDFTLNDSNWSDGGSTATRSFNNVNLAPGSSFTTTIVLEVGAGVSANTLYTNVVEISSATDDVDAPATDTDSVADSSQSNDDYERDNWLAGKGTRQAGADEDDQDPAVVTTPARLEGTITIVKQTIGSDQTFEFSSADGDLDSVSLTTSDNVATSSVITKSAGTYIITEDAITNWTLSAIDFSGDLDIGSVEDTGSRQATIDLDADEDIIVTFTNVQDAADLSLTKTANVSTATSGNTIVYLLTLTNAGPETATGVQVTDQLPSGITYDSHSATLGTYTSGTGVWDIPTLPVGTVTLTITATVD